MIGNDRMNLAAAEPQSASREFCCLEKAPVLADSAVDAALRSGGGGAGVAGVEPRLGAISFMIPLAAITRTITPDFAASRQLKIGK